MQTLGALVAVSSTAALRLQYSNPRTLMDENIQPTEVSTMKNLFTFLSLLIIQLCSCSITPQIPLSDDIGIRDATFHDINDITTVLNDAFSPAPFFRYYYQFYKQHRKYSTYCTKKHLQHILKSAILEDDIFIKVIETPSKRCLNQKKNLNVVAVAVWETSPPFFLSRWNEIARSSYKHNTLSYNCSAQLDVNMTRALDYDRQFSAAMEEYVSDDDQVYLSLLATHPEFDGNGYGAAHCRWGMSLAKEKGLNVTLIATPAGHPLYKSLGFEEVKNITINRLDGKEALWFEFMRWTP